MVPIEVLLRALTEAQSPYAHTIAGAHETPLPVTDQEVRRGTPAGEGRFTGGTLLGHNDLP
jgi:nitrate reductase molybdenum cofactor assembly chaperone NarJ/NarW